MALTLLLLLLCFAPATATSNGLGEKPKPVRHAEMIPTNDNEPPPIHVYPLPARFNDDLLLLHGREEGEPLWHDTVCAKEDKSS